MKFSSTGGNAKSRPRGKITPDTSVRWGPTGWKAAWQRMTLGSSWTTRWPQASNALSLQRRPVAAWAPLGYCQQVEGGDPSLLFSTSETYPEAGSGSGFPRTRYGFPGRCWAGGYKDDEGTERLTDEERLRELGLFSLGKSGAQWEDKRQRAQTETHEIPSDHSKALFLLWECSNTGIHYPEKLWSLHLQKC